MEVLSPIRGGRMGRAQVIRPIGDDITSDLKNRSQGMGFAIGSKPLVKSNNL